MTVARAELVDVEVTPYYHCISRCVRKAHLCGDGYQHRKEWIEKRLELLSHVFAVQVCGYAVMDNHLHVLVRLEPERALHQWSDEEVIRRWAKLCPPRGRDRRPQLVSQMWLAAKLADKAWIGQMRQRLADLGWFMKCLKEPLARQANREDECSGAFWEARYRSIGVLDEESLLATCIYIDLNPVAAGVADLPERSSHTSIRQRVEHCRQQGGLRALRGARLGLSEASPQTTGMEDDLWLCPIEDQRDRGAKRAGLLAGFSLAHYLQLVDWTSRLVRQGKARVGHEVAPILERLGTTTEIWQHAIKKLFSRDRLIGVAFAFRRERLQWAAAKRGRHHLVNLNGCPA